MAEKFIITTPVPTVEETAKRIGVSLHRVKELRKLADEVIAEMAAEEARKRAKRRRAAAKRRSASKP